MNGKINNLRKAFSRIVMAAILMASIFYMNVPSVSAENSFEIPKPFEKIHSNIPQISKVTDSFVSKVTVPKQESFSIKLPFFERTWTDASNGIPGVKTNDPIKRTSTFKLPFFERTWDDAFDSQSGIKAYEPKDVTTSIKLPWFQKTWNDAFDSKSGIKAYKPKDVTTSIKLPWLEKTWTNTFTSPPIRTPMIQTPKIPTISSRNNFGR